MSDLLPPPSPLKPLFSAGARELPPEPPKPPAETPLSATLGTTFRFLYAVLALLVAVWLCSGIRSIEPGMQAVVFRGGAIDRAVGSGLVLAWPRPFEEIVQVPGPERQLSQKIERLDLLGRELGVTPAGAGIDPRRDGGFALTGDAGVVHLRAEVAYTVTDPRAFVLARERVATALERCFLAATITACAGRSLDGVMVASQGQDQALNESLAQSRERLRGDIIAGTNRRLTELGIGISATRADLTAYLPDRAKPSFDAVVAAESSAAKEIAEARTYATRHAQEGEAKRAQILGEAGSRAQETLTAARVATDRIRAVLAEDGARRALLVTRLYRERIDAIVHNAGGVVAVPADQPARVYLPGR